MVTGQMTLRKPHALLAFLFFAALALRLWGIGHGLPHTYHPDEHQYVDMAVSMVGGELNPGRFNNPSGLKYALALVFGVWAMAGSVTGAWNGVSDFQDAFAADPTSAYILARSLVALMGATTALATFALARRLAGTRAGLVAAAFLAFAFLHARDSHYAVSDVPAALFVTLVLLSALRVLDSKGTERTRWLLAGAVLTGLATGTKYSALAVIAPLLFANALAETGAAKNNIALSTVDIGDAASRLLKPRFLIDLLLVPLVVAATFLAIVPFSLLNRPAFIEDLATLAERGQTGFKGLMIDPAPGWIFYLDSLAWGLGPPLLFAAIVGIGLALISRRPASLVVASFPLLLWAYLGGGLLMFARFMIPAIPALCVLAATGVEWAASHRWIRRHRLSSDIVVTAITIALIALPFASTLRHDLLLTREDTRTLTTHWIETNIPSGTPILLQSAGPDLMNAGGESVPGTNVGYAIEKVGTLDLPKRTLDEWRADGYELLVTSSFATERRMLDPQKDAAHFTYYAALEADLTLLSEFTPSPAGDTGYPVSFVYAQVYGPATDLWRLDRTGPIIRVYQLAPY